MLIPDVASPEDLEQMGFENLRKGELKEGLKLILRAAKRYEEEGKLEDAARLYYYFGYFFLDRLKKPDKARPPLLKSAALYIDLIEKELSRFDVDTLRLNEYCTKTLSVFATVGDEKNLKKYAKYFAEIYEDIARSYLESDGIGLAVRAYEDAFRYYKIVGDDEAIKRIADGLITVYGRITEEKVAKGDAAGAAEAFYRLAGYVLEIFGYDAHYIEMMDTAARNYEKASKLAYSRGNLDGTTTYLLKSQYSYLLAGNTNRSKLMGLNSIRITYQVISSFQSAGRDRDVARKLLELGQSLLAVGKTKEAFKAYKESLNLESSLRSRVVMRAAILKIYGAQRKDAQVLSAVSDVEYYLDRNNEVRAVGIANETLQSIEEVEPLVKMLHEAEGISQED